MRLTRPSASRLSKATSLRPGAAFHVVHKNPSPLQLYLTHNFLPPTTFTLEQTSFLPFSRWRPSLPRIRLGLVFASACLLIDPSLTLRSKSTSCMMAISIRINQAPDSLVNSWSCPIFRRWHVSWHFVYPSKHLNNMFHSFCISLRARAFESLIFGIRIDLHVCKTGVIAELFFRATTAFQQLRLTAANQLGRWSNMIHADCCGGGSAAFLCAYRGRIWTTLAEAVDRILSSASKIPVLPKTIRYTLDSVLQNETRGRPYQQRWLKIEVRR